MKQCPNCKAEIQENARFCLYCMTSFEEKAVIHTEKAFKKSKVYVIALALTMVLLTFIAFVFVGTAFDGEKTEKFSSGEFSDLNNILDNSALFSEENENNSANINFGSSDDISQEGIEDSNGANGNASHISDASNVLAENSSAESFLSDDTPSEDVSDYSENVNSSINSEVLSENSSSEDITEEISSENSSSEYVTEEISEEKSEEPPFVESSTDPMDDFEVVVFGSYEQDNNIENGKEKIEWYVIDEQNGKALILSKSALDNMMYDEENSSTCWETSTIRRWLNDDFYNSAFTDAEKLKIQTTTIPNRNLAGTVENDTTDNVFLLSLDEVNSYFACKEEIRCYPSEYVAKNMYADNLWQTVCVDWWLRTGGQQEDIVCIADYLGQTNYTVWAYVNPEMAYRFMKCVRPALWVDVALFDESNYPADTE